MGQSAQCLGSVVPLAMFLQLFPTFSLVLKNLVGRRFLMLVSALGMAVAQVLLHIACLALIFTMPL